MNDNANFKPIEKQLAQAYAGLLARRGKDDPNDDDDELAAAEHYMYARWQVCSGQTYDRVMIALTNGYDVVKLVGYVPIVFAIRKLAGHSWSYPSASSRRWGMRGISDGQRDRSAISKDPAAGGA